MGGGQPLGLVLAAAYYVLPESLGNIIVEIISTSHHSDRFYSLFPDTHIAVGCRLK